MVNRTENIYNDRRWRKLREQHLAENPLCVRCKQQGRVRAGVVVDHIIPHKKNQELFWDRSNLQTLCNEHHSSVKQSEESRLLPYSSEVGKDGTPLDKNHPFYA